MEVVSNKRGFIFTVRTRMVIGFLALGVPLLILILLLLPKVDAVVTINQQIRIENLPQTLDTGIYETLDILDHWIMTQNPEEKTNFEHLWTEINNVRDQWDSGLTAIGDPKLLQNWTKLQQLYEPLYKAQLELLDMPRTADDKYNLHSILYKMDPIKKEMLDIINGVRPSDGPRVTGLYNELIQKISKNTNTIDEDLDVLKEAAYWLFVLAIVLTILVPFLTQYLLAGPVDNAINIAERIAAGERNVDIQIQSVDKLGKLLLSLKAMQEAIRNNEAILRNKEEDSRELFEKLVNSSKKFRLHSSKVASGDLRERLQIDREDVLQDLGKDLNLMTDGLASITKKITHVSNEIVAMVGTVITSAHEQAESITSQASAINEISASLEEIDKSSKQTMNKAQALREVAKSTYEQGKLGTESVAQSIYGIKASEEKMKLIAQTILDLSTHTQQIGDITAVVNTLAQQSKMLALNASIEASKAGEAGKGFAAVATEVRNLAEQSEQSTVQVQKILEDIRRTTERAVTVTEEGAKTLNSGTKLIEKAGTVIQALSTMINEASMSSQHIEVAIRQEAVGIEQIVESMNEINRTTSAFSSNIKEMMAFIHKLGEIAKHLKADVDIYKV
jgi:methyl-accepting chemotaxis protein